MAKGVYVGVDGLAKKVKHIYVGIDGVARKVKKGWIGDENGIARLFYTSEISGISSMSTSLASLSTGRFNSIGCQTDDYGIWAGGRNITSTFCDSAKVLDCYDKNLTRTTITFPVHLSSYYTAAASFNNAIYFVGGEVNNDQDVYGRQERWPNWYSLNNSLTITTHEWGGTKCSSFECVVSDDYAFFTRGNSKSTESGCKEDGTESEVDYGSRNKVYALDKTLTLNKFTELTNADDYKVSLTSNGTHVIVHNGKKVYAYDSTGTQSIVASYDYVYYQFVGPHKAFGRMGIDAGAYYSSDDSYSSAVSYYNSSLTKQFISGLPASYNPMSSAIIDNSYLIFAGGYNASDTTLTHAVGYDLSLTRSILTSLPKKPARLTVNCKWGTAVGNYAMFANYSMTDATIATYVGE